MEPQVELRAFPHIAVLVFSKKSLNAYFSLVVLLFNERFDALRFRVHLPALADSSKAFLSAPLSLRLRGLFLRSGGRRTSLGAA